MTALATDRSLLSQDDYYSDRYPPTVTRGSGELVDQQRAHVVQSGSLRVVVEGSVPDWLKATVGAVARLLDLETNWDSYGATTIDVAKAKAILVLLLDVLEDDSAAPSIVPTSAGGIQAEWHIGGIDLEIEVLSPFRFGVSFEDSVTGREWEGDVTGDGFRLQEFVAVLAKRAV